MEEETLITEPVSESEEKSPSLPYKTWLSIIIFKSRVIGTAIPHLHGILK